MILLHRRVPVVKRDHVLSVAAVAAAILLLLLTSFHVPAAAARSANAQILPGSMAEVRAAKTTKSFRPIRAPAASSFLAAGGPSAQATADIQVTYNGFSAQAQAAFEAAVTVWESQIVSSQVIRVNANWTPLGTNVLGSASSTYYVPLPDGRYYSSALAEALCGCPKTATEINANFNSNFSGWYLGTDGNGPSNAWDFYTVVLHEIGHGLGFFGTFNASGSNGSWGVGAGLQTRYDQNEWTAATGGFKLTDTAVFANPSAALKTELTDGSVYFGGPNVVAELGSRARLFAPATWSGGSSNSHFDESTFAPGTQHALMTPSLSNGEVIHDPGPLTRALFRDLGWMTSDPTSDADPPVVSAPSAVIVAPQQIGTTAVMRAAWPAATDESGVASYELQRRKGTGAWTAVTLATPTSTSADVAVIPGSAYTFRLRASDTEGNMSDWTTTTSATLALVQESGAGVVYGGTWKNAGLSGSSGGTVRYAGGAGRSATFSFSGTSAAFVSTRGPGRGIAEMWLDGVFVQNVDLYNATTAKRSVVWAPSSALAPGAHTLEVRVNGTKNALSTKSRVDVDAFLAWQ
ncbi:MAG TPA: hypothetical protein VEX62_02935 [Candidatus Limnocylindrales bacterium]|nr:hypothetical protein [Candidatus Limnocylindrales bacterium]